MQPPLVLIRLRRLYNICCHAVHHSFHIMCCLGTKKRPVAPAPTRQAQLLAGAANRSKRDSRPRRFHVSLWQPRHHRLALCIAACTTRLMLHARLHLLGLLHCQTGCHAPNPSHSEWHELLLTYHCKLCAAQGLCGWGTSSGDWCVCWTCCVLHSLWHKPVPWCLHCTQASSSPCSSSGAKLSV